MRFDDCYMLVNLIIRLQKGLFKICQAENMLAASCDLLASIIRVSVALSAASLTMTVYTQSECMHQTITWWSMPAVQAETCNASDRYSPQ